MAFTDIKSLMETTLSVNIKAPNEGISFQRMVSAPAVQRREKYKPRSIETVLSACGGTTTYKNTLRLDFPLI